MDLDIASEGNFNTINPEEAARLIKKLASNSSTKNIEYEKKFVESLDKNQMAEVKAKLVTCHILLNKEASFAKV